MGLVQTILRQAEKLKYQMVLPAKESVMFADGIKYQTGSDYDEVTLKKEIGELAGVPKCGYCRGTGDMWMTIAGEPERDICDVCEGTGYATDTENNK